MTKKDYVKIAKIIKDSTKYGLKEDVLPKDYFINKISRMFKEDNSNFDKYRFIDACDGTISSYEMGTGTTATAIATERTSRDICSMQNTTYIFTGGGSDGQGVTKFEIGTTTNSAELGTMSTNTASYGTSQSTTHGYLYGGNQSTAVSLSIYEYEFDTSATITDVADLSVASSGTNASGSGTP